MTVCAIDVRGTGELWPEVGRGNRFYTIPHSTEEEWGWASLIIGKPLVGQRVNDILAFVRALDSADSTRGRRVVLAALGGYLVTRYKPAPPKGAHAAPAPAAAAPDVKH